MENIKLHEVESRPVAFPPWDAQTAAAAAAAAAGGADIGVRRSEQDREEQ